MPRKVKVWADFHNNPCGKCKWGWIVKDGERVSCPDCDGTEFGLLEPPDEKSPYTFVVTVR